MTAMKTAAAIHDLSCYAKSSLTVVIPTLAALQVEASILPTALLSTQTDGFDQYVYEDLTDTMGAILCHWKSLKLFFDAIYSGFLGSQRQIDTVADLIGWQRNLGESPLVLIDPVMGDQGEPYGPMTSDLIRRMGQLVRQADVITPNVTEAALLLGEPYSHDLTVQVAQQWAERLSALGPKQVAITSVMDGPDGIVVAYDANTGRQQLFRQSYAPVSFPGCGDLFASILCATLVHEMPFCEAVSTASQLVSKAVYASWEAQIPTRQGVAVEYIMKDLVEVFR
jgi:pyridoxine kinase